MMRELAVAQNRSDHTIGFPGHVQLESDALSDFHGENPKSTGRCFRRLFLLRLLLMLMDRDGRL